MPPCHASLSALELTALASYVTRRQPVGPVEWSRQLATVLGLNRRFAPVDAPPNYVACPFFFPRARPTYRQVMLSVFSALYYNDACCLEDSPMRYRVVLEQDEDGVYIAECPSLPGCVSQGSTREEALTNIKDAMAGYLESLRIHNEPIPPSIWEETVDITL